MQNIMVMGILKSTCHLFENDASFLHAERALGETLAQCAMFDVWHNEIAPGTFFSTSEDWHNMFMFEHSQDFYLMLKAFDKFIIAAIHHFDGYLALHTFIIGEIDLRHPSAGYTAFKLVMSEGGSF